ncbi:MAG TPA: periplasmic heavy metal sensor [Anaeromyxobacteraceae bacterium]|nr:periplasmic heavy metal sensor [Anaeromyxobacteraceae bacterium]
MKNLVLAALPLLALAANAPGDPDRGGRKASDETAEMGRMQKRVRLAFTLGLSEALDLDEASALRVREVVARFDGRRAPLHKQVRDSMRVLRDAASGDKAAAGQVDQALKTLREAHNQMHGLVQDLFHEITQGLPPERKAKAALFFVRFRQQMGMLHQFRQGPHGGHACGPGGEEGRLPHQPGSGMEAHRAPPGDLEAGEWFADD